MKPGRNDPCSCGSGKKFKHCCERNKEFRSPLLSTPTPSEMNQLMAFVNKGRHAEAENTARSLLALYPDAGHVWKQLSLSLLMQGKDSLFALQKTASLLPDDAGVHNNLGNVLHDIGQVENAVAAYRRAVELKPVFAMAHNNLGNVLRGIGEYQGALKSFRRVVDLEPGSAKAHFDVGVVLQYLGNLNDAVTSYRRALELKPDLAVAYSNLGYVLKELGQFDAAVASCRKAVELKPDLAAAHSNLGYVLNELGQFDGAVASCRRAVEIKPDLAEAHYNLGNALKALRLIDEAEVNYRRALQINPNYAEAHLGLGLALLISGRIAEGWQRYEYRWDGFSPKQPRPATPLPQWIGQSPLNSDCLLVFREQGMGDNIQFSRYLPLASERFAGRISVIVDHSLLTLFRRSFPDIEVLEAIPADQSGWQFYSPLLSLPLAFNTSLETIPKQIPYLIPDPARVTRWKDRIAKLDLPAATRKIGMVWKPGSLMKNAPLRALTLRQLAPLLKKPGDTWFSLQKETDPDKIPWVSSGKLIDWAEEFSDFDDTAALLMNLDLVITVDTSVAHLAGGLGRPTWLFNRYSSEWRWMYGREDSPWYPTMRIFTQKTAGDWDEVVKRMAIALG